MRKFKLNNIKSFVESDEIEIKPLTFFVGKNSCGKSSLIRFPVVLAETFKEDISSPLLLFGDMLDYGNYDDVVYKHKSDSIGFTLEFGSEISSGGMYRYIPYLYLKYGNGNSVESILQQIDKVSIQVQITKPDRKMVIQDVRLNVNNRLIFKLELEEQTYNIYLVVETEGGNKEIKMEIDNTSMLRFNKFIPNLDIDEIMIKYIKNNSNYTDELKERYCAIIDESVLRQDEEKEQDYSEEEWYRVWGSLIVVRVCMAGIYRNMRRFSQEVSYVGPFRVNPKRTYRDSESNYDDVGVHGENVSMLLRQDAQKNRKLIQGVSKWFNDAMGYTIDIKEVGSGSSLYSLVVKNNSSTDGIVEDNIIDVGYGISQVLPIVTQLLMNGVSADNIYERGFEQKKTFIIEQPELHLHPAAQAELANLLAESIKISRSRRVLVETHSEHLLRKLQVLIANPDIDISSDQVAIYYVEKDESGDSHVRKMEINNKGQFLEEWPSGFFDKSYELSSELLYVNSKTKN